MSTERIVHCAKLGKDLPGLKYPPLKGELGKRVYEQISAEAWDLWVKHSTLLINEYRLNPGDAEAQKILKEQLEKFLFGGDAAVPEGYVAPDDHGHGHGHGHGHDHDE